MSADDTRLTVDQALAELDRAPAHLLEVEARHGFTFGGADTGPGQPVAAVVCTAPTCPRRGQHVQIHDDTVQPVHCGGCSGVLHCDHQPETRRERTGTLAAVVEHVITACTRCGTELDRQSRDTGPVPLDQIPVAVLDQEI